MGATALDVALVCFVVLATVGTYSLSGLDTDFAFDDTFAITGNGDVIDHTRPLTDLLKHDFWGQRIHKPDSHKSFRPLTVLSFRINHLLHGLSPRAFHVVNIGLHAAVCVLAYVVSLVLWPPGASHARRFGAAAAALLFGVHPVHVEAVTGLVGRAEMLSGVFYCLGFLLYHWSITLTVPRQPAQQENANKKGRERSEKGKEKKGKEKDKEEEKDKGEKDKGEGDANVDDDGGDRDVVAGLFVVGFVLCYVCATLSKETGFTVLGVALVHELLCLRLYTNPTAPHSKPSLSWPAIRLGAIVLSAACYLVGRAIITVSFTLHNYRFLENPIAYTTGLTRVLTTAHLHAFYAAFLVWPHPMCADWSFDAVPLLTSLSDPRNCLTAFVYSCVFGLLVWSLWPALPPTTEGKPGKRSYRHGCNAHAVAVCVVWGGVSFFPAANILFPVGTMVAERLLYMPSLPFCLLCGAVLSALWEEWPPALFASPNSAQQVSRGGGSRGSDSARRRVLLAALVAWVAVWCTMTDAQNKVWETDETLFMHAYKHCGGSAKIHHNVGIVHRRHGDKGKALKAFNKALEILPTYCDVTWMRGLTAYEIIVSKHGSQMQRELIKKGAWAGLGPAHVSDHYLDDFDAAVRCKYVAQQASPVMEQVVNTLLNTPPHSANVTIFFYAGNLFHAHTHYDQAAEYWCTAMASETQQLRKDRVEILREQAQDVVDQINLGCPCKPQACPDRHRDCTPWAHAASLLLTGNYDEAIAHMQSEGPIGPDAKLANRISKWLYHKEVSGTPRALQVLELMCRYDPTRLDFGLAFVTQLAQHRELVRALEELDRLEAVAPGNAGVQQHRMVLEGLVQQGAVGLEQLGHFGGHAPHTPPKGKGKGKDKGRDKGSRKDRKGGGESAGKRGQRETTATASDDGEPGAFGQQSGRVAQQAAMRARARPDAMPGIDDGGWVDSDE